MTKIADLRSKPAARRLLGQPRTTLDLLEIVTGGKIKPMGRRVSRQTKTVRKPMPMADEPMTKSGRLKWSMSQARPPPSAQARAAHAAVRASRNTASQARTASEGW